MPLTTPQEQVAFGLRAIGVLGVGQTALPEDYSDAFAALNGMIAGWNAKRWLVYHLIDVSVNTTGQQSYTIGPGGDIYAARPTRLEGAYIRQFINNAPNFVDYPLTILQSREDYSNIALKTLGTWPVAIFYDSDFPVGSVFPWPVPQAGAFELHLLLKATLRQFDSYVQSINLPDEYTEAIWTNLAIRLAAIYPGSSLPEATVGLAKASLETIRTANAQIPRMEMPTGLQRKPFFNIYSGQSY
jgi:hypothetical protein